MQELSEFNLSQNNNLNKLQNKLLEYEQNNSKVLEELEMAKGYSEELLKKLTEKNNRIIKLEEDMKKSVNDKKKLEQEHNHKLQAYRNKLEVS